MPKQSNKYYVVIKGKQCGIYTSWEECQRNVSGYRGAIYKSFKSKPEAKQYQRQQQQQQQQQQQHQQQRTVASVPPSRIAPTTDAVITPSVAVAVEAAPAEIDRATIPSTSTLDITNNNNDFGQQGSAVSTTKSTMTTTETVTIVTTKTITAMNRIATKNSNAKLFHLEPLSES
jgi:transcription initiation factor TFIID subunit TAF12